jgi:hypothetical protein
MMLSARDMLMSFSLAQVMVPVATYFLILGLLNCRRTPQMLTGLEDAFVLCGAMSMFFWPVLTTWLGAKVFIVVFVAVVVGAVGVYTRYRPRSWVIYNLPVPQARRLVLEVLSELGWAFDESSEEIILAGGQRISFEGFAFLRNATVRLHGAPHAHAEVFSGVLARRLGHVRSDISVTASMMVVVAVGMLVVVATAMAPHGPEIVRQIAEFLP